MFVVVVDWQVAPENAPVFGDMLAVQARNSLDREPACRQFDICRDRNAPGRFLLYEIYDDAKAFDLHLETSHFKSFSDKAAPLTLAKEVRTFDRIAS
ncbi:putative quinol monooxygenase [Halovulum sp. GXIMD14794]